MVCGMLARAVFFVSIGNLARFLLNKKPTNRRNLRRIMDDVDAAIGDVAVRGVLAEDGHKALRRRAMQRRPAW